MVWVIVFNKIKSLSIWFKSINQIVGNIIAGIIFVPFNDDNFKIINHNVLSWWQLTKGHLEYNDLFSYSIIHHWIYKSDVNMMLLFTWNQLHIISFESIDELNHCKVVLSKNMCHSNDANDSMKKMIQLRDSNKLILIISFASLFLSSYYIHCIICKTVVWIHQPIYIRFSLAQQQFTK